MLFASSAARLLVLARTGDARVELDLLVDPSAEGVSLTQQRSLASDTQYEVELDDVRVPRRSGSAPRARAGTTWDR